MPYWDCSLNGRLPFKGRAGGRSTVGEVAETFIEIWLSVNYGVESWQHLRVQGDRSIGDQWEGRRPESCFGVVG